MFGHIEAHYRNNNSEPDLSVTQLKRWVINKSSKPISKDQESLLAGGLNFVMTHTKTPKENYVVLTEEATTKLKDPIQNDLLRNKAMGPGASESCKTKSAEHL